MHTTPARPLVVVTCGAKKKTDGIHPAGSLYLGSYHSLAMRAAHALTAPHAIRVLSYAVLDVSLLVSRSA